MSRSRTNRADRSDTSRSGTAPGETNQRDNDCADAPAEVAPSPQALDPSTSSTRHLPQVFAEEPAPPHRQQTHPGLVLRAGTIHPALDRAAVPGRVLRARSARLFLATVEEGVVPQIGLMDDVQRPLSPSGKLLGSRTSSSHRPAAHSGPARHGTAVTCRNPGSDRAHRRIAQSRRRDYRRCDWPRCRCRKNPIGPAG